MSRAEGGGDGGRDLEGAPLGRHSRYNNEYNPGLLHGIPRQPETPAAPFGEDIWNAYEISWLNERGLPRVAWGEFRIAADSPCLIESKSLKLYLNSLNGSRFAGAEAVREALVRDLSACAQAPVRVKLGSVDGDDRLSRLPGESLDAQDMAVTTYQPAPEFLRAHATEVAEESLHTHLFRSLCPVTGQPDWASVLIRYQGPRLDRGGLLAYLVSFREHGDFHEHCVERIFQDLLTGCRPERLSVYARFLRRGGLDINPWRSTHPGAADNLRLWRQ